MTERAEVRVTSDVVGEVSPLLFGADVEHVGRQVYGGIWDSERDVPRADVQAALRALGVTFLRYPGSINCSQYRWQDGVGPKEQRRPYERTVWTDFGAFLAPEGTDPTLFSARLGPREPNLFGTDEFLQYCLDIGAEPLLAANLGGGSPRGEGTPDEAAAWVRYCNVDRRAPRPVRWWSVGYEPYASYELGHCSTGAEYAKRFLEFFEEMRKEDPSIKFTGPGLPPGKGAAGGGEHGDDPILDAIAEDSPLRDLITETALGTWNEDLLRVAGDQIDALAFHFSFPGILGRPLGTDEAEYLQMATAGDTLGAAVEDVIAQVDAVVGAERRLPLYLDEWGRQVDSSELTLGTNHRLYDALYFAGCYNRMLERADRVRLGTMNFLVNALGHVQTDGDRHFVTAAYLVTYLYRWSHRERSTRVEVSCGVLEVPPLPDTEAAPMVVTPARTARRAPVVDAVATLDDAGASVFLANRSLDAEVEVTVTGLAVEGDGTFRYLTGPGPFAQNTVDAPGELRFAQREAERRSKEAWKVLVPPATVGVLTVGRRHR